jgi:hypothetical protein
VIDDKPSSSPTIGANANTMIVSLSATWESVKFGSPSVRFDHTNTIAVHGAAARMISPGCGTRPRRLNLRAPSDGTIPGVRKLGNLLVPSRLSPRWRGGPILNGFPSDRVSDDLQQRFATGVPLFNDRLGTPGCLGGLAGQPYRGGRSATIRCNLTYPML